MIQNRYEGGAAFDFLFPWGPVLMKKRRKSEIFSKFEKKSGRMSQGKQQLKFERNPRLR